MSTIKATPTEGLCYSPNKEIYWDQSALRKEIDRVFDICHGCRLCFNLCPSFPSLFDALDAQSGEADVRKLSDAVRDEVVDGCFQCKLCYVKCPYTPDDGHEFQLDFPRLMLRYTAQKAKRDGISLRDKFLGNPMALGKLSSKAAPIVIRPSAATLASLPTSSTRPTSASTKPAPISTPPRPPLETRVEALTPSSRQTAAAA